MITLKTFVCNPFQENTYILHDETKACAIVDPGCYNTAEMNQLLRYIADNALQVEKIINTHAHIDHIPGIPALCEKFGCTPHIHPDDMYLIHTAKEQGKMFGFVVPDMPADFVFINEGDVITFGNTTLQIYFVPGHSRGSVAFYSAEDNMLITGDVLFKGSIGRTDLPGGDYDVLMKSIREKILVLPEDTLIFPGHGPHSTIGDEKLHNPFLYSIDQVV